MKTVTFTSPVEYGDEIWRICSNFLFSDDSVVNLSLFGTHEISEQIKFIHFCTTYYKGVER